MPTFRPTLVNRQIGLVLHADTILSINDTTEPIEISQSAIEIGF